MWQMEYIRVCIYIYVLNHITHACKCYHQIVMCLFIYLYTYSLSYIQEIRNR